VGELPAYLLPLALLFGITPEHSGNLVIQFFDLFGISLGPIVIGVGCPK
jgi:hypothetical protein